MAKVYSITINDNNDVDENVNKIRMYQNKINLAIVNRDNCDNILISNTVITTERSDQQLLDPVEYNPKYEKEYFYRAIGPVLRFGQIFTLMPLPNVLNKNLNEIKFKWISFYTFVSIGGIVPGLFEFCLFLISVSGERMSINIIGDFLFYVTAIIGQILLFQISVRWNVLLRHWYFYENVFMELPYKRLKYNLQFKVRLAAFTILFLAIVEHVIAMGNAVYTSYKRKYDCNYNETFLQVYNVYHKYPYFEIFGYNTTLIVLSELVNFVLSMTWTFVDVVIVVISIGLITRFQQINERIKSVERQSVAEIFWIDVRKHYINLTELVNIVNKHLKFIVILSCSNNLYFVCQQIYNSVSYFPLLFNKIYFWYSLIFIIMRMLSVLFAAAQINDISTRSIEILRQVPSYAWSIEAGRFTEQLLNDCVAISGYNFFYITRRLIFAMAGTLITYEIVLLDQFDSSNQEAEFCPQKLELIMYQG